MVQTQTGQQIDKVIGLAQKTPPSPRTVIDRTTQNQTRHPQQYPLFKGNIESLCIYDIPLSAFPLPSAEFMIC